jgi:hypothetical protein
MKGTDSAVYHRINDVTKTQIRPAADTYVQTGTVRASSNDLPYHVCIARRKERASPGEKIVVRIYA